MFVLLKTKIFHFKQARPVAATRVYTEATLAFGFTG